MKRRKIVRLAPVAATAAALVAVGISSPASAAVANASVANDTLTITANQSSDSLALRLAAADPNTLEVDFGDNGSADFSFERDEFSHITVRLLGGNDRFRVDQVNGPFADEALLVDGGIGNDTMDGGDGVELFLGGGGDDAVDGNKGNDAAALDGGRDSFRWDPGDGSDLIDGGGATDTLDFNGATGAEVMSLSASGEGAVFLRDLANIRMGMNNVEVLDLTALEGTDSVTINDMTGTDFRRANVDLSGPAGGADGAADVVTVNGTPNGDRIALDSDGAQVVAHGPSIIETRISGSEATDRVQVNSLEGNDKVSVDGSVFALIGIGVDLGPGQL